MKLRIQSQSAHQTGAISFLRWIRNVLFVVGVLALGYYGGVTLDTKIYQRHQTHRFQLAAKEAMSSRPVRVTSPGVARYVQAGSPLGQIQIRKIGLAVMILEGTDQRTLRRAVGHIPETALPGEPGNVAIAGHRDTFFRNLRTLEKNDEIMVTTLDNTYHYLVDSSEVVEPTDIEVLKASDNATLTLVTCYPTWYVGPAPKRLIIHAHVEDARAAADERRAVARAVPQAPEGEESPQRRDPH
jgi:sortase A